MATKESKKGAARPKRSKEDTQQEFARISEEVAAGLDAQDAKTAEAARFRETQVRQAVDGIGVETVVQKISGLGLEVALAWSDHRPWPYADTRLLRAWMVCPPCQARYPDYGPRLLC